MDFWEKHVGWIVYVYLLSSIAALMIRLAGMDCEHRYVDYVLPVSKIHCKI